MASDVIKEFLVALGFKIDEPSFKKFETGIGRATKSAYELGQVVVATATAIAYSVTKIAENYEELYYVAQRTGASVASLQAFEYGAKQIGVTAGQSRGAVEGLARSMRSSPGVSAVLNQLGVQTRGQDTTQILNNFVRSVSRMPFYLASQYGRLVGIDDDTLLQLILNLPKAEAAMADYNKRQKEAGVDAKGLSKQSLEFVNVLEKLESDIGITASRIAADFLPAATKVVGFLDETVQWFNRSDAAINGWATTIGTIATTALGAWIGKMLLMKVLFRGVATEAAAAAATAAGGTAAGTAAGAAGGSAAGLLLKFLGPVGALLGMTSSANEGEDELARQRRYGEGGSPQSRAMSYFLSKGWSREAASGIVSNLYRESKLDPNALGDGGRASGVAQWHPDRQAAFRAFSGKDLRGSSLEEQLAFVQHELTKGEDFQARRAGQLLGGVGSAGEAGAIFSRLYERPADSSGEQAKRAALADRLFADTSLGGSGGSQTVTLNQKTDIHMHGSEGNEGRKVVEEQGRINADVVRNLVGAMR